VLDPPVLEPDEAPLLLLPELLEVALALDDALLVPSLDPLEPPLESVLADDADAAPLDWPVLVVSAGVELLQPMNHATHTKTSRCFTLASVRSRYWARTVAPAVHCEARLRIGRIEAICT
jgi:hypothetical protein